MRADRREKQAAAFANQQKVIAQKERTITRFMAKASKTSMAQSMQKQLDKMDRIELDAEDTSAMRIRFPEPPRSGQVVVEAKNLSKSYDQLQVLNKVDFKIERGERVAFVGQNGQGKTTLAKILIDEIKASEGEIIPGHNVHVGYYAQNQAERLHPKKTLLETMEDHSPEEMRTKLRGILGSFLFSGEDVEKKVSVLSGGERARLAMACMLLRPINLLVLDEPTNHLDMISKDILKQAIMDYEGTLIIVSHDRDFLQGLTDKTIEFRDKKLKTYLGDVEYFLDKRELENMREVELQNKQQASKEKELSTEDWQERKRLQREVHNFEKKIEALEAEIERDEAKMAAPEFFQSDEAAAFTKKYEAKKEEIHTLMEEWEKAQEALEAYLTP